MDFGDNLITYGGLLAILMTLLGIWSRFLKPKIDSIITQEKRLNDLEHLVNNNSKDIQRLQKSTEKDFKKSEELLEVMHKIEIRLVKIEAAIEKQNGHH